MKSIIYGTRPDPILSGLLLPDLRTADGSRRRRPPDWVLRLTGLSLGGLVVGLAIGLRLPA